MKNVYKTLFFLALLSSTAVLLGWGDSLVEIGEKARSVRSIQADFTQEKHLAMLDQPLISKGKLKFKHPHCLRWEYIHPIRSILIMNEEEIRRYVQNGEDLVEQSSRSLEPMRVFLQEISRWIQGEFDRNPHFKTVINGRTIELVPENKEISGIIERIVLKLTDTPGLIESATIYENESTYTVIRFNDGEINQNIDDQVFTSVQ